MNTFATGVTPRPMQEGADRDKWDQEDLNAKSELILIISPAELKEVKNCKLPRTYGIL